MSAALLAGVATFCVILLVFALIAAGLLLCVVIEYAEENAALHKRLAAIAAMETPNANSTVQRMADLAANRPYKYRKDAEGFEGGE